MKLINRISATCFCIGLSFGFSALMAAEGSYSLMLMNMFAMAVNIGVFCSQRKQLAGREGLIK